MTARRWRRSGPSGAGKSTLLRVAGMLVKPTTGQVRLDGDPVDEAALRLTLAAVLQRPLLRRGKVIDNAALGLRFRGVGRADARRRGLAWLVLGTSELTADAGRAAWIIGCFATKDGRARQGPPGDPLPV